MIGDDDLAAVERTVHQALLAGDVSRLPLLGEGDISLVIRSESDPAWACKRLPPFPSSETADRYAATVERYLTELAQRGIELVETDVRRVTGVDGAPLVYCVQPVLPPETLAVDIARRDREHGTAVIGDVVDAVLAVVDERVGLDAQLANWAVLDGRLAYFDITTPLLRRADLTSELDSEVFLASLPWALRGVVRRFVSPSIIERYHDPRTVLLDLGANLVKERLDALIPAVLDAAGQRVTPPLSERDVRRDRRADAATWGALQAARRIDRTWQRHVRRRPYPFLLPTRHGR